MFVFPEENGDTSHLEVMLKVGYPLKKKSSFSFPSHMCVIGPLQIKLLISQLPVWGTVSVCALMI